jgi:hypothetical protein
MEAITSSLRAVMEARRAEWERKRGEEAQVLEIPTPNPPTINEPLRLDDKKVYGVLLGTSATLSVIKYAASLSEERTEASLSRLIAGGLVVEHEYDKTTHYKGVWNPVVKESLPDLHQWLLQREYVLV